MVTICSVEGTTRCASGISSWENMNSTLASVPQIVGPGLLLCRRETLLSGRRHFGCADIGFLHETKKHRGICVRSHVLRTITQSVAHQTADLNAFPEEGSEEKPVTRWDGTGMVERASHWHGRPERPSDACQLSCVISSSVSISTRLGCLTPQISCAVKRRLHLIVMPTSIMLRRCPVSCFVQMRRPRHVRPAGLERFLG